MIGSITPIARQSRGGWLWWCAAVTSYALGSMLASTTIGVLSALIGEGVGGPWSGNRFILIGLAFGLAAVESSPHPNPLSERLALTWRQTSKGWLLRFGPIRASFLWGTDLGFGLTTRVNFVSFWLLLAASLVSGSVTIGALIMGGYGVGRTIELATGPFIDRSSTSVSVVSTARALLGSEATLRRLHAFALALTGVALLVG